MEQLIMNNADRVRSNVNNNGNGNVNVHENNSNNGSTSINKLLALTALLLFALIAAPAQAIVVTYTHTDAQGTVVATSDANRNVTRFGYEPYGLPSSVPEPADAPGYTGHVHDANSGLVYMQQRYYDPETGQFLSTDPVGVSASTGANFNRYNYAANNPYRFVDPDGRNPCENGGDDCGTGGGEKKAEKEGAQRSGRGFAAATIQVADRGSDTSHRLINPQPGGGGTVTFDNDVPGGPSTNLPVDPRLAEVIEAGAAETGFEINVNSTTGGHSSGPHPEGRASDINKINKMRVDDPANAANVEALQRVFINHPNTNQVLGPVLNENKWHNAPSPSPALIEKHKNHIHVNVPPSK